MTGSVRRYSSFVSCSTSAAPSEVSEGAKEQELDGIPADSYFGRAAGEQGEQGAVTDVVTEVR